MTSIHRLQRTAPAPIHRALMPCLVAPAPAAPAPPLPPPSLGGRAYPPRRLDYGSTYASKFERLPGGRLVINTWVYDTADGCVDSCSDHSGAATDYFAR